MEFFDNKIRIRYGEFREMSPADQRRIKDNFKRYKAMPPERRQQLRDRYRDLTPEQRKRLQDRMTDRRPKPTTRD